MTDVDLQLLKAITAAIDAAETTQTQHLYMDMLATLVCMYGDTKRETK